MVSNKITVNRVYNYCNFLIGFLLFNGVGKRMADGLFINYTEYIQQHIGYNVTLHCNLKGLVENNKIEDITYSYHWYFKQCGGDSGVIINCYATNVEWTQLPCQDNICKSEELHLKNVTEQYSGLYKCTVIPNSSNILNVKLERTFQLHIKNSSSLKVPEMLDPYQMNKTISKGSQVVFQCRVYSEVYPSIKWFRRLDNFQYNSHDNSHAIVYYNSQAYKLLISSIKKTASKNVYLSKLIINDVQLQDEGYYACVAIGFRGHNIREAYLKVYVEENDEDLMEYWSDYNEEDELLPTDSNKFWLLFLMPVGLALLPLFVWLCYAINKHYQNYYLKEEYKYLEDNDQQSMLKT